MSLREEIVLILQREKRNIDHSAYKAATEEIISLFEKRIDTRIKYYTSGGLAEQSDNLDITEELLRLKEMLK